MPCTKIQTRRIYRASRVVNSKGELSGAFAFGGENEQKKRLEADGIKVEDGGWSLVGMELIGKTKLNTKIKQN